jgi:NAD(P) transhydrogenase subunit beta
MPGHMHVLLAEAEVDPDILFDLREINSEFRETDLALIVGACDVVNPAAIHVQGTPISGMPILAAHEARQVVVCNRDEKPGYSGVANPLYADPKTILVFGDAKVTFGQLLQALGSTSSTWD